MGVLLANHCDEFNKQIAMRLIKLGVPVDTIISDQIEWFERHPVPKKTQVLDCYDFYYQDRIKQLNRPGWFTLTAQTIHEFVETENLFLKISDRLAYAPITVHERLVIYNELLRYWLQYFETHNTELVIFAQTPHTGYDNVLYAVAEKKRVPIVVVSPTVITDRVILRSSYLSESLVPENYKKKATKQQLVAAIDPDLLSSVYNLGSWGALGQSINKTVTKNNSGNVVVRVISRMLSQLLFHPMQSIQNLTLRTKNSGFIYLSKHSNLFEQIVTTLQYVPKKKLAAQYAALCKPVSLRKKYVYFSLHYQPERTTMPEGDVFENQQLAIEIIAKSLPKHWQLYVKDHPRQFTLNDVRTNAFRNSEYYKKIAAIPNVMLVSVETDSQLLIANAQCTASVQGTASWESLLKHKPSLVFSNAWYAACRSCFLVDSVETCKEAFAQLRKKTPKVVELDLLKYLHYTQDEFITSAFLHQPATMSLVPYGELVGNLAEALRLYYEQTTARTN